MGYEDLMAKIEELLDEDDTQAIDELAEEYEDDWDPEEVFLEAIRRGASGYVRSHVDDFDLNDFDVGSRMLVETDDPGIREILIDNGAVPDPSYYYDYRMHYDNCTEDFDMDDSLCIEMVEKVLKLTGLTVEDFAKKLKNCETAEENLPEPLDGYTYADIQAILEIIDEADVDEEVDIPEFSPYDIMDFMSALDYDIQEEGQYGPHGHGGWIVYYVE